MVLHHLLSYLIAALTVVTCAGKCRAGFTFFGPTPYLSAADSPFAPYLGQPYFHLEDFEDGLVNTPGISQRNVLPPIEAALGVVVMPGPQTNSVDADDGTIDGFGFDGHSFRSNVEIVVGPLVPPTRMFELAFDFDAFTLGTAPNAFGVVWTNGPANSTFSISITTPLGDTFSSAPVNKLGANSGEGNTSDDVFLGVISDEGIASVRLRGSVRSDEVEFAYIEIDHLQYGFVIPEPISVHLALFATACSMVCFGFRGSLG